MIRSIVRRVKKVVSSPSIPIIPINGIINAEMTDKVTKSLQSIGGNPQALLVAINSRGGLPVQSHIIAEKLKTYARLNDLKLYTYGEEVAASGGYMIMCVGDEVFADSASIVGSIGVLLTKTNMRPLLDRLHIHNHILSSNSDLILRKLNPYDHLSPEDKLYLEEYCRESHLNFIEYVQRHRKGISKEDEEIFSGQVYSGEDAVRRGLVDECGTVIELMKRRHPKAKLLYSAPKTGMQKVLSYVM